MALLAFLDVAYPHQPANAGALFFELYQQSKLYCTSFAQQDKHSLFFLDDSTYAIQLDYLNVTNGRTTHRILLPGSERR